MTAHPWTTPPMAAWPALSDAAWDALEERIEAFEAAWARGERPRIAECLAGDASGGRLLFELVHTELELRLRAGEPARVEEYLVAFPKVAGPPGALADLLAAEYRIRRRSEPGLTSAEYLQRFPALTETLAPMLESIEASLRASGSVLEELPELPGFQVIREVGRGGGGIVYEARDVALGRLVAVKTLRANADPTEWYRLRREARAAAQLRHPNVAQLEGVAEQSGRLFIISEYLPGGTLADRIRGGPMPLDEAVEILEPIARAVHAAHAAGIIHRDLKPANILFSADGTPKVADFGLAKRLDGSDDLTRTGVVAGTACYMAPEQAAADKNIGPAMDIWSLGAILYELLTGRPPFRGPTAFATLEQVRSTELVPPRCLVPDVPRDLETICLKCLEKEPSRRYPTAATLADDIARFQRGECILARRVRKTVPAPGSAELSGGLACPVKTG